MPLASIGLALALCASAALAFVAPARFRWAFLLAASYAFVMLWGAPLILPLLASTLCNYLLGRLIASAARQAARSFYLGCGLIVNLGLLLAFKLLPVVWGPPPGAPGAAGFDVVLPIGLSFYTFKGLAYIIDVWRGALPPEPNLGVFAAYLAFFPQVMAGPIERPQTLLPQLRLGPGFDEVRAVQGLRLMLWGAFKKAVIADRLGVYVNAVYGQPRSYHPASFVLATLLFAFQIYADFSGYSDLANGAARLLGFAGMDNFRRPYFARSLHDFWGRWHISLSGWVREYVFLPLSRRLLRATRGRWPRLIQLVANLVTMGLIGLWHGASAPFAVWGGLHGLALSLESLIRAPRRPATGFRRTAGSAGALAASFGLVCLSWIFFRSASLSDALYILAHLGWSDEALAPFGAGGAASAAAAGGLIGLLLGVDALDARWGLDHLLGRSPVWLRWALYYAAGAGVLLYGFGAVQPFIYFKF